DRHDAECRRVAGLRPQLLGKVRDLRYHPGRGGPGLSTPLRHPDGVGDEDRRRRNGADPHRRAVQPRSRTGSRPALQPREIMFDRYFGALLPAAGQVLPGRAVPSGHRRARTRIAAASGPIVSKLAVRLATKNDPERMRSVVVGPLAKIIRPVLNSPRSSVLGPVDTAPFYALRVGT